MFIILGKRDDLVQHVRDTAHAQMLMAQPGRNLRHVALASGRHAVAWEEYSTVTWTLTGNVFDWESACEWCRSNDGWTAYKFPDWLNEDEIAQRHGEVRRRLANRILPLIEAS